VVVNEKLPTDGRALPGSTFSGNPLAASAVIATLSQLRSLDVPAKVAGIEKIVNEELKDLTGLGIKLRGRGALWILEFPPQLGLSSVVAGIRRRGVVVAPAGSCIRLLPPATISAEHLSFSCAAIRAACFEAND
jgi:acetylornithine/succinyldiaminopimelate/putrescine aminotransferase